MERDKCIFVARKPSMKPKKERFLKQMRISNFRQWRVACSVVFPHSIEN